MKYDSTQATTAHIRRVGELLEELSVALLDRARKHDASKLQSPEKEVFDEVTPQLAGSTYGSEEYKGFLANMKPCLDHHYANNRHHPEHFANGINSMNLLDLLEMLCDWKAAGECHANGSLEQSLRVNKDRFSIPQVVADQLLSTANECGWLNKNPDQPKEDEG